jgi:hypothetical protein
VQRGGEPGQSDGADRRCVLFDECDVNCPVRAWRLAELAGAVDRVDDPDAFGGQPGRVVSSLFRQDGIVWPASGKQLHQQKVAPAIAFVFQFAWGASGGCEFRSNGEEKFARLGGDVGSELVVIGRCHGTSIIACGHIGSFDVTLPRGSKRSDLGHARLAQGWQDVRRATRSW